MNIKKIKGQKSCNTLSPWQKYGRHNFGKSIMPEKNVGTVGDPDRCIAVLFVVFKSWFFHIIINSASLVFTQNNNLEQLLLCLELKNLTIKYALNH